MKITYLTDAVRPMANWLMEKKNGTAAEEALREILSRTEYGIEFARYADPALPVCGISFEEAVDFFLHFTEKDFENPRLQYKKPYFQAFYDKLQENLDWADRFTSITDADVRVVEAILKNALPEAVLAETERFSILSIISIGNSMGWVHGNVIDYDAANMRAIDSPETFLHLTAHEIHHAFFPRLMPPEASPAEQFLLNFAYEGLAMHFANNAATKAKPSKYPGPAYAVSESSWQMYLEDHDALLAGFWADYERAKQMTEAEVQELIAAYETFDYESRTRGKKLPCEQYPTYYIGCEVYGAIDLAFGKETLFRALLEPERIPELYRQAKAADR